MISMFPGSFLGPGVSIARELCKVQNSDSEFKVKSKKSHYDTDAYLYLKLKSNSWKVLKEQAHREMT